MATLFGLEPAPPAGCRLLELGCGEGGNLVPMAYALPGGSFCGIDLSGRAIERARAATAALGLGNVVFREADLSGAEGEFDYVVAHGVYSWIEPERRDALLAACRDRLAPQGVAYVSYDVLPGGYLREITRRMLRWHLRGVDDPAERIAQARALLEAVVSAGRGGEEVRRAAERALAQGDASLYHDELAPHHEAVLFADFAAHAERHGLRFLAEADVFEMSTAPVAEELAGLADDVVAREQYLDFFKGRMFRQTLLRHAGAPTVAAGAEVVRGMLAASPVHPAGDAFEGPGGARLTSSHALVRSALTRLGEAWPDAIPVAELATGATEAETLELCETLSRAYAANLVHLHVWSPPLATEPGERPVASALARLQVAEGERVTTLRHTSVEVPDALGRRLIALLDGTRDRAALLRELDRPADELERSLEGLARISLLERR